MSAASNGHQKGWTEYIEPSAGHQVCVRSFSDQKDFSLPITFLTASYLAGLQKPGTGTTAVHRGRVSVFEKEKKHPDSPHVATSSHQPKPKEGRVQRQNSRSTWSLWGELGHSLSPFLSLPLHVSLSLFNFLSLGAVRATELRLERGVGNKWRTLPDSLQFYLSALVC